MLVAVTGASGLIGSALSRRLAGEGHRVLRLVRGEPAGPDQAHWDPTGGIDVDALAGADAVVHLAGKSIGGSLRWTGRVKREILESRVRGTELLARTMAALDEGPRVLVCASGVDYYGDRGDEELTEASAPGDSFLAGVCRRWEAAADPAREAGIRVAHLRTALVQATGGVLDRQLLLFRAGLGGRLGSGRQWWSWIALDDVVGIYRHAVLDERASGPLNAVSPNPVTNAEHAATLARVLRRPAFVHVPAFALEVALGRQLADELLLSSKRALPAATLASGYEFRQPDLEPALRQILGRPGA